MTSDATELARRTTRHSPGSTTDLWSSLTGLQLASFCQLTDGAVMLHFRDGSVAHVDLATGKITTRVS